MESIKVRSMKSLVLICVESIKVKCMKSLALFVWRL